MPVRIDAAILIATLVAAPAAADPGRKIERVLERWRGEGHMDLKGVIVVQDGRVVAERYYNGETVNTLHDVRSAGKSVTSLLTGIAIDAGILTSIDEPVAAYWKEARGAAIGTARLRDVLTMRSGVAAFDQDPLSPGNEDRLDKARDPLAFVLNLPRSDPPGSVYRYNSVTASIAGVVIARAARQSLAEYAREHLFTPLSITRWKWEKDAAGYTKGQGNLWLTLRSFAAIGEMVRNEGAYRGRRIVSAAWIRSSLAPQVPIGELDPYADGYGYFWYSKTHQIEGRPVLVSFASGNGGNKLYVVPGRRMVVAITSSAYGRRYGQKRSEDILKAVLIAGARTRRLP